MSGLSGLWGFSPPCIVGLVHALRRWPVSRGEKPWEGIVLKIRDVMTTDVLTLSPATTVREAAELLVAHHVGGAPVVAGQRVVGVLSLTDIADFEANVPAVPSERTDEVEWGDLTETPRDYESEAEPAGTFFTELWTDVGAEVDARFDAARMSERDVLGEHTVDEVMSRTVHSMSPDAQVDAAAYQMQELGIHRVLVMDKGKLLGIVTTMDVAKAVAEHKLTVRQYVFDRRGGVQDRESEF